NTGIRRGGHRSGHPGNDFKLNPGQGERFRFFSSSPKDKRIPAFQSHDHIAGIGAINQQPIDGLLLRIFSLTSPSDIDSLSSVLRMGKKGRIGEIVVENHISLLKALLSSKGQESGISGTGTD